ncbi:helix-turn-helix transcriptional regulator [Raoultibacter phocaeensis]|uniref:helix-turn-helix transcriptional regulator n=1 Tax=Raoultibacter phocaeensis TaxID=2479841 RepID=UPI0011190AC7|nr:helix-turn-helix transcriptional regulator [Raoultibacter phocaeensis]
MPLIDMNLKKAHVRTMLPMASAGFALFWAWFYLLMFGPSAAAHLGTEDSLAAKLAFLLGMVAVMLAAYLKRSMFDRNNPDPIPLVALALTLPIGVLNLISAPGSAPLVFDIVVWALAGGGFSLIFLEWPKVFMVAWQKDVGAFLASGAAAGAVIYLFSCNLAAPYGDIALLVLPACSLATFTYLRAHIAGSGKMPEEPVEQTKLFPLTGFTVAIFGALFGFALFYLCQYIEYVEPALVALAIVIGAGVQMASTVLIKRYVTFGIAERLSLLLVAVGFLGLAFLDESLRMAFFLYLLGVLIYFDFANLGALVGFASGQPSPFWRIARGQLVLPLGIAVSWTACMALTAFDPSLFEFVPFVCLGLVLALAILAAFVPFKDNAFADKSIDNEIAEGGHFKQRCTKAAEQYGLSNRETEILSYLAKGRNAQYISEQLNISAYTAKTHVYHIYQKMGVNSQQELITIVDSTEVVFQ